MRRAGACRLQPSTVEIPASGSYPKTRTVTPDPQPPPDNIGSGRSSQALKNKKLPLATQDPTFSFGWRQRSVELNRYAVVGPHRPPPRFYLTDGLYLSEMK